MFLPQIATICLLYRNVIFMYTYVISYKINVYIYNICIYHSIIIYYMYTYIHIQSFDQKTHLYTNTYNPN